MTNEEFETHLHRVLSDMSANQLLSYVPDIYCEVAEYFNNEVIENWEAEKQVDEDWE